MNDNNTTNKLNDLLEAIIEGEVFAISPCNIMLSKGKLINSLYEIVDKTIDDLFKLYSSAIESGINEEHEQLKKDIKRLFENTDDEKLSRVTNNILTAYTLQTKRASFMKLVELFVVLLIDKVVSGDDNYLISVHLKSIGAENVLKTIDSIVSGDDRMFG